MQTLKEVMAEIESLRQQLFPKSKRSPKPQLPATAGNPPVVSDPSKPADQPKDEKPAEKAVDSVPAENTREKARARLKEIRNTSTWHSAQYSAAVALEEDVAETELNDWLKKLEQRAHDDGTSGDVFEDVKELIRVVRNKRIWKEDKQVPAERKAQISRIEHCLAELVAGGTEHVSRKSAEVLHEHGASSELRILAGNVLGMSEIDILSKEWEKGKKLDKVQLESVYNNLKDWRLRWKAGKELGISQADSDVYENKGANREDRLEASRRLGIEAAGYALHERQLGKDLTKDDLKHIWIGAKDQKERIAAAKELGYSKAKIWMAENALVVCIAGVVLFIVLSVWFLWPKHH